MRTSDDINERRTVLAIPGSMKKAFVATAALALLATVTSPAQAQQAAAAGDPRHARVAQTGQRLIYATGDDGYYRNQVGVAWPKARFTDNGDGTIRDNLTTLIWLKNANCPNKGFGLTWQAALDFVAGINAGTNDCSDTSKGRGKWPTHQIDWRLPNVSELLSLVDRGTSNPALPADHPFTNFQVFGYWSSTSYVDFLGNAWAVFFADGFVSSESKAFDNFYVIAVRGGS